MADYQININAKDNTKNTFSKVEGGLAGLTAGAGKFKAALGVAGAALAAFGAVGKIQDTIDEFDALAKSARIAGAAASEDAFRGFQVLQKAMGEAGVDAATFERAMLQTTSRLQEGLEGGEAFADIFAKLGDNVVDSNGKLKDGSVLLTEMINALNNGTISTDEFAKVVGGRAGPIIQQQFASLNTSAEGLAATLADVEANSNIVSLEAADNAEVFNDTVGRMGEQMSKLMTDALTPLLPMLVELADKILANMPAIIEKVSAGFQAMQPILSLIGTILSEVVAPVMGLVFDALVGIANAIAPLVEAAIPALKAAFEGIVNVVQTVVDWFTAAYNKLVEFGNYAIDLKNKVTGAFSSMSDSVTSTVSDMTDSAVKSFYDMWDEVVGHSIVPDMVDAVIDEFTRQRDEVTSLSSQTTTGVTQHFHKLGTSIQDDFINTFANALGDGKLEMNDFRGFFEQTLNQLITSAFQGGQGLNSVFGDMFGTMGSIFSEGLNGILGMFGNFGSSIGGILGSLFGGGGGGNIFGSIISGIGSFFGFMADGGNIPAGGWAIAGEAGPEIITGPATVTPMDKVSTSGGPAINITIQSIDTQTGTEFLLKNKKQIEGIINSAYNKRGRQGIV